MKKFTSLFVCCLATTSMFAQWSTLNRSTSDGKEIPIQVNNLAEADGKLYAATTDGIWVSASKKGGDWAPFGLQGQEIALLNFGEYKLAAGTVKSPVDTNKDGTPADAGQVYILNDGVWETTGFNPEKHKSFHPTTGFVQLKDDKGTQVIVVPTWGNGIWRSEDAGKTWTVSPYAVDDFDESLEICKTSPGLFYFPGDNVIYGTDKASADDHYLIRSYDYGKTWEATYVTGIHNPWCFTKRQYNGGEVLYFGGEKGDGNTVMRSENDGVTWTGCFYELGGKGTYTNNRYMLGFDEGPLFVMCAHSGVFLYSDEGEDFERVGDNLQITNANAKSLTHLLVTDNTLYCSSQEDFIQTIDVTDIMTAGVEGVADDLVKGSIRYENGVLYVTADSGSNVSVYSLLGSLVKQVKTSSIQTSISTDELIKGVYVVEYMANGKKNAGKILVK